MARPSKLTTTLLDQLETIADDTWSIKHACQQLGISEATWRAWEQRPADGGTVSRFLGLAARVRASSAEKTDELAWGVLRQVLADESVRASDKIAAASTILRLRTAHRVELTGRGGGPVEVDTDSARAHLVERLQMMRQRQLEAGDATSDA